MDVIVFGTGEVGRNAAPFIEKNHHILFWTDNSEQKWETPFGKYLIKNPEEIKKHDCAVVIASTKYEFEIARQLEEMGIARDRIYFCRKFQTDDTYEYEIYPLLEGKVMSQAVPLVRFDMFHIEECENNYKKVLILCSFYSTFTKQVIENMSKRYENIEFSLLTNAEESKEKILSKQLKHIYYYQTMSDLKTILEKMPVYDAIQSLWIEKEWGYFYQAIRKKAKRLNLHVGGSDFYRAGNKERNFKKKLIESADTVTTQSEETKQEFGLYYGEDIKNKIVVLPLGIEVLDYMDCSRKMPKNQIKEKYHIPMDKIVVTCGHNGNPAHQHIKIINALKQVSEDVKQHLVYVFPMTYPKGNDAYINEVCEKLNQEKLNYVILTEFMNFQEMAEYASISDIMIHVQTTDALSSAMREEMYAGSIIIAGKWLPYQSLHKMGIFFLDVDTIADVADLLENIVVNIEEYKKKCIKNKEIIWNHSSWDKVAPKWRKLWD